MSWTSKDDRELYERYVRWWTRAVPELLGWPTEETLAWAHAQQPCDRAGYMALFNYGPAGMIAPLLVSKEVRSKLREITISELVWKIRATIEREPHPCACCVDPAYDWGDLKRRLAALFEESTA